MSQNNMEVVVIEDLYRKSLSPNIFFVKQSDYYYNKEYELINLWSIRSPFKRLFSWSNTIVYISNIKEGKESYFIGYYEGNPEEGAKKIFSSSGMNEEKLKEFINISKSLHKTKEFSRSIHFISNTALAKKLVRAGVLVLKEFGIENPESFFLDLEDVSEGHFLVEVEFGKLSHKYIFNEEEVKERIPSYFSRPNKMIEKISSELTWILNIREVKGRNSNITMYDKIRYNEARASVYLPTPLSVRGEEAIYSEKKETELYPIIAIFPVAETYQPEVGRAKVLGTRFLHRHGVVYQNFEVHLLEPFYMVEYKAKDEIAYEIAFDPSFSKKDLGYRKPIAFRVGVPLGKSRKRREKEEECENKKIVEIKYDVTIRPLNEISYKQYIKPHEWEDRRENGGMYVRAKGKSKITFDLRMKTIKEEVETTEVEARPLKGEIRGSIHNLISHRGKDVFLPGLMEIPYAIRKAIRVGKIANRREVEDISEEEAVIVEVEGRHGEIKRSLAKKYELYLAFGKYIKEMINLTKVNKGYSLSIDIPEKVMEEKANDIIEMIENTENKTMEVKKDLCFPSKDGIVKVPIKLVKNLEKVEDKPWWHTTIEVVTPIKIEMPLWEILEGGENRGSLLEDFLLALQKHKEKKHIKDDKIKAIYLSMSTDEKSRVVHLDNKKHVAIIEEISNIKVDKIELCSGIKVFPLIFSMVKGETMTISRIDQKTIHRKIEIYFNPSKLIKEMEKKIKEKISGA